MVARTPFIAARSKQNVGDHLMHPTESEEERDRAGTYEGLPDPGEHRGTVPVLRRDTTPAVAEALALRRGETPTREEVHELAGGYRADGSPVARSPHAARWNSKSGAARQGDPTGSRRTDVVDVMLYPHPSWGIAHANAETEAGAAAVLSAVRAAAEDTMAHVERELGWTRRGKGGRLGPEPGDITWISFVQHTPRPTGTAGEVTPGLHVHNMVPAVVVTEGGHVGAMDTNRKRGLTLGDRFHERLAVRGREMGIEVEMRGGVAVLPAVPGSVVAHFSKRDEEARRNAQDYAARRGLRWDSLPPARQSAMIHAGARATQGGPRDGMADRARWREECAALGFPPTDVARPAKAGTTDRPHALGERATPIQRAAAIAADAGRTRLLASVVREQAAARARPMPDLRRQAEVVRAVEAMEKALEPRRRLAAADALRRVAEATGRLAAGMGAAIRGAWARHGERRAIRRVAAPVHDFHRENHARREARLRALELARETTMTRRLAAGKRASGAIRSTVEGIRMGRAADAIEARFFQASREKAAPEAPKQARARRAVAADGREGPEARRPETKPAGTKPKFRVEVGQAEAEAQLRDAMSAAGIRHGGEEIRWDGRMHYLPVDGNRGRERSGAYRAHHDEHGAAAALYNWKAAGHQGGFVGTWKAHGELKRVSPAEAERAEAARAEEAAKRGAQEEWRHARAASRAQKAYAKAKPVEGGHPYLEAKGLAPVEGMRVDGKKRIVVPLRLVDGRHVNNQTITAEGDKRPVFEARKNGAFFVAGKPAKGQPAVIAEGLATGLRVHRATGLAVVVAVDSGNLAHVAKAIRDAQPGRPIVFAADNDHHLPAREGERKRPNEGVAKAEKAAKEVGNARVWAPPALPARAAADKGTDWDDYGQARGDAAVAAAWKAQEGGGQRAAQSPIPAIAQAQAGFRNPWETLREKGAASRPKGEAAPSEGAGQGVR